MSNNEGLLVARDEYRGHKIEIIKAGGARPFRMRVNGELLRGSARVYTASSVELALEAAHAHVRKLERTSQAPRWSTSLEFQPENYVAHAEQGKYVISVLYKGRPIGEDPRKTYAETEFLPYFHPRMPAQGEPRCTFLVRGDAKCTTLQQAIDRCVTHAGEQLRAAAPTAPGADA